jgi:hypothetical protein
MVQICCVGDVSSVLCFPPDQAADVQLGLMVTAILWLSCCFKEGEISEEERSNFKTGEVVGCSSQEEKYINLPNLVPKVHTYGN